MYNSEWLQQIFSNSDRETAIQVTEIYENFIRAGFIYSLTGIIESAMRSIVRKLNPDNKGVNKFNRVYKAIFQHLGGAEPEEFKEALNLLTEIRNCIHNNGVYYPRDLTDEKIEYRGSTFHFRVGEAQGYSSNKLLLEILEDIFEMFKYITSHKKIKNFELIPDVTVPT